MSAAGHVESHHLLDSFYPYQSVRNRRDVIKSIPVRSDHRVHAVLGNFLHPAMEIADVAVEIDDRLAIKLQDHAQHAMGAGVLRPHVERHLWRVEQGLTSGGNFDLMHITNRVGWLA